MEHRRHEIPMDEVMKMKDTELEVHILLDSLGWDSAVPITIWNDWDRNVLVITQTVRSDFEKFIHDKLNEEMKARLAALPWWCLVCGEGGNYVGERPDEYWLPPEEHVCQLKEVSNEQNHV